MSRFRGVDPEWTDRLMGIPPEQWPDFTDNQGGPIVEGERYGQGSFRPTEVYLPETPIRPDTVEQPQQPPPLRE